jgi:heptosyltransferase I
MLPLAAPPKSICILRLSAIGDTCHVVPLIRTLQQAWPATRLTWIIGALEARLMSLLTDVEFIIVDKRPGPVPMIELRRRLRDRSFDVLLHLQLALRASLIASQVPARVKLGFDFGRARELQWLFTNARVAPREREHVLDSLFGFAEALGVGARKLAWDLPLPPGALEYAARLIPASGAASGPGTLIISPCSSHTLRNWNVQGYAALARHATQQHGMKVILTGGPSALERDMGLAIERAAQVPIVNQIGKDTLPELLALLARATVLLTPDSGPAHMATMVGTPVIGLYAATNPARSGPYLSRQWCVDRYAEAARRYLGREPADLSWTTKIERPGVMELIDTASVVRRLDELLAFLHEGHSRTRLAR